VIARVESFVLQGIEAIPCEVEADISTASLPATTMVGLPDAAVRESIERVRTALLNGGFRYPPGRITINLAPAHIRKEGPVYDLPIAVALLRASGTIESQDGADVGGLMVAGELALDGRVRPVRGVLSLSLLARERGKRGVIVPAANASEAAVVDGIDVLSASTVGEVVAFLNGTKRITPPPAIDAEARIAARPPDVDFADVRGQEAAKRALTVAAAGGHNVLMVGPAGTGKTMMARALPGILPPLTRDEALEVSRIYSCAGRLEPGEPLVLARPVRAPHHTASSAAIVGGGTVPRAGDVTLAHRGVLFLDEMPEFSRAVLETLRQPLEEGAVTIARAHGSVRFPARFMLVAALNPTRGGDVPTDDAARRDGSRYLSRLSGPLVDRVDVHVEVPAVGFDVLAGRERGTGSASMRRQVDAARAAQRSRQGAPTNAELPGAALDRHAALDVRGRALLEQAMGELGLSARAYDKVRRVARTCADLEGARSVGVPHVAEAIQYRILDRR
jgi:magnesium chelatase family protein